MIELFVRGISIRGDGFDGWQSSLPILAGRAEYRHTPAQLPPPAILAPNERRRAGPVTRLALAVAREAAESSGLPQASLRTVFGSSNGDGATIHTILTTLASADPFVSPTLFHNSVHNAAAGYWSIGAGSAQPATCIGSHDFTVGAVLLAAAAEVQAEQQAVLMCVYDIPFPEPLNATRPCSGIFGAGLVLGPTADGAFATMQLDWRAGSAPAGTEAPRQAFGGMPVSNPAGRILRLLETLARQEPDHLSLGLLDGHVDLIVQPCLDIQK